MADPFPSRNHHAEHVIKDGGYSGTIVYVSNNEGAVELEICTTCHYIIARCEHNKNTWNEAGDELACDLCGIDGT